MTCEICGRERGRFNPAKCNRPDYGPEIYNHDGEPVDYAIVDCLFIGLNRLKAGVEALAGELEAEAIELKRYPAAAEVEIELAVIARDLRALINPTRVLESSNPAEPGLGIRSTGEENNR